MLPTLGTSCLPAVLELSNRQNRKIKLYIWMFDKSFLLTRKIQPGLYLKNFRTKIKENMPLGKYRQLCIHKEVQFIDPKFINGLPYLVLGFIRSIRARNIILSGTKLLIAISTYIIINIIFLNIYLDNKLSNCWPIL